MKRIVTFLGLMIATPILAQHDQKSDALKNELAVKADTSKIGWTKGGVFNIGLNEGILENWASGGERMSLAANGQFSGFITRVKGRSVWENNIELRYGLNYVESNDFIPRKLDDRIDFSSRYGLQPHKWTTSASSWKRNIFFMGLFRFQSQFTEGYNYSRDDWKNNPISQFLSPAYFTLALGAEFRANDHFSLFLSPLAGRMTIVKPRYTEFSAAYGVEKGQTSRMELGAYFTAKYRAKLAKNINYVTRLDFYSNYLAKNKTMPEGYVRKDNPGNIDILWDNDINMKFGKFIGAGFGLVMIYDNDQPGQKNEKNNTAYGPLGWWQLKQVLSLRFNYKF